jgi:hypothetical protein
MLDKHRLEGPTRGEWAAAALTPATAELLKDAVKVLPDDSVSIDLSAPASALAEIGRFLHRLGVSVHHKPVRVAVDDVFDELEDVIRWVADARLPVEISVEETIVHIGAGPAPPQIIDVQALAIERRRRDA